MINKHIGYSVSLIHKEVYYTVVPSSNFWGWQYLNLIISSAGEDMGKG